MKQNKFVILMLGIVIGVLLFYLLRSTRKLSTQQSTTNITPSITGVKVPNKGQEQYMNIDDNYYNANKKMLEETKDQAYRSSKVGGLLDRVPHSGKLFTFEYSYQTGKFTVTLLKGQLPQANAEFDAWLKENGVQDQSWIQKLDVKLE